MRPNREPCGHCIRKDSEKSTGSVHLAKDAHLKIMNRCAAPSYDGGATKRRKGERQSALAVLHRQGLTLAYASPCGLEDVRRLARKRRVPA